jgi:hypothetical protein
MFQRLSFYVRRFPVAGTSVACTLDLSFSSWVTEVSMPINIIIIRGPQTVGTAPSCPYGSWDGP